MALTAGATPFGDLPLSDRARPWDAAAAAGRWRARHGIDGDDPDWSGFRKGFAWYDSGNPEAIGSYKLPFVDVIDGTPTAIFRGVTAAAGALQGARGGVDIPSGDVAGVRSHLARYYDKAAEQYDDENIRPPWEASTGTEAWALAYAETGEEDGPVHEAALLDWLGGFGMLDAIDGFGLTDEQKRRWAEAARDVAAGNTLTIEEAVEKLRAEFAEPKSEVVERKPRRRPTPRNPSPTEQRTNASQLRWTATLAPEGIATDDGRLLAPDAISWRSLPMSLMAMTETAEGHDGARVAGRIDNVWRDEKAGAIRAEGVFDDSEFGQEVARMVGDGTLTGISVDLAIREYVVRSGSEVLDDERRLIEGALDEDERVEADEDEEPSILDILFGEEVEDPVFIVTDGVIGMATVCSFPAFAGAEVELRDPLTAGALLTTQGGFVVVEVPPSPLTAAVAAAEEAEPDGNMGDALTAAAAGLVPELPPASWFADPELDGPTPLMVDDDGRIFGHAALWGTCHIGIPGECTTAPTSPSDYAYFRLGACLAVDDRGEQATIPVGKVTIGTGHAPLRYDAGRAAAHYDNTGTVCAYVAAGEDAHGIWVAGALRPDFPADRVHELRAASLSGDWRVINGQRELVALLAVNVPGFPVPRPRALAAAGGEGFLTHALVAAGIVTAKVAEARELDEALADRRIAALSLVASS